MSDFDGNGIVTPLEALSAIQRIGYIRNAAVVGDAPGLVSNTPASSQSRGTTPRLRAATTPVSSSNVTVFDEVPPMLPTPMTGRPAAGFISRDEDDELFLIEEDRSNRVPLIERDDDRLSTIDDEFAAGTDWLSVV